MLNLIIFGAPGAGKGTQAQKIASERTNLKHLSTGSLLREEIAKDTDFGKTVKNTVTQGGLVDDKIVDELVKNEIKKNGQNAGFIFDGYPRNLNQARTLDNLLAEESLPITLNLEVSENELLKRLELRGQKDGRSDDTMETIKHRLKIYHQETVPLLNYYASKNRLINIDGNADIESVYQKIQTIVDKLKKN
jgi:adenylate kinase